MNTEHDAEQGYDCHCELCNLHADLAISWMERCRKARTLWKSGQITTDQYNAVLQGD